MGLAKSLIYMGLVQIISLSSEPPLLKSLSPIKIDLCGLVTINASAPNKQINNIFV